MLTIIEICIAHYQKTFNSTLTLAAIKYLRGAKQGKQSTCRKSDNKQGKQMNYNKVQSSVS